MLESIIILVFVFVFFVQVLNLVVIYIHDGYPTKFELFMEKIAELSWFVGLGLIFGLGVANFLYKFWG
jgi:hypothetical protein